MKKTYKKPEIKAIEIKSEQTLLAMSDAPQTCGVIDDYKDWD